MLPQLFYHIYFKNTTISLKEFTKRIRYAIIFSIYISLKGKCIIQQKGAYYGFF